MVTETQTLDSLAIAERAVELALAAGATQAEALVMRTDEALTRFANSQIHQNVSESNTSLNLRFVDGKRIGVASTNRLDDEVADGAWPSELRRSPDSSRSARTSAAFRSRVPSRTSRARGRVRRPRRPPRSGPARHAP